MGKLTGKGKHTGKGKPTVKVGHLPHTNMISNPAVMRRRKYKCRILKMHLRLRDEQLKTILYIYRLLHENITVTTNQKSTIDIHTKKKKESKHNTKDSHQITREGNKKGREEKQRTKRSKNN